MSNHTQENTIVTVGVSHQADAFQGGREAAQAARQQMKGGPADLVLAFGRGDFQFQDFIEGVRLVTGEDTLVGFPSAQVVSSNLKTSDASVVLLMQSSKAKLSLASFCQNGNTKVAAITSLISQFREKRGNQSRQFKHRFLILIDNLNNKEKNFMAQNLRFEAGLLTEMVAIKPPDLKNVPLLSQDKVVYQGFVAIEILSNERWGAGAINIGEFKNQKGVSAEAAKTIYRRALSQMESKPSCGLLFSNSPAESFSAQEWESILQEIDSLAPGVPLVGISTGEIYIHQMDRPAFFQKDALAVLLLP